MPHPLFLSADPLLRDRAGAVASRLPALSGFPVHLESSRGLQDERGPIHAGAHMRERRIVFNCSTAEFPRVFVHEVFHFVWLRGGNPLRWSFEDLIAGECRAQARGELGWSAEWRKHGIRTSDAFRRGRRWREYICESFCDTAAWLYSGVERHPEFTHVGRYRKMRRQWFEDEMEPRGLSI